MKRPSPPDMGDPGNLAGTGRDHPVSIMISGPTRIGKSRIAAAVAEKIGAEVVVTDRLRAGFRAARDPAFARISRYTRLIGGARARGTDLVLEGVDLLKSLTNERESLQTLDFFRAEMGCLPAIIGPAPDESEKAIARAITRYARRNKDYVYKQNDGDMQRVRAFAATLAADHRRLGDLLGNACNRYDIPYFAIRRAEYVDAVQQITDRIAGWALLPETSE